MNTDEVFQHLLAFGFAPSAGAVKSLERKFGPITLRASVWWEEQRVSIHGSYRDARTMADTEGMLSRSVADMLMNPIGLLPVSPTAADIADRIDDVFSELPDPPPLARLRLAIVSSAVQDVNEVLSQHHVPAAMRLGRERGSMLHYAKSEEMVRLLSAYGVDPNLPARSGKTPLFETNDLTAIEALFAAGASAAHRDRRRRTVLHHPRPAKVVLRLIDGGADPNARDHEGSVPLHHCQELPALVRLLAAGAEVNAQDDKGRSALMRHLEGDRVGMVALLLAHGAQPDQADAKGETGIFFARSAAALHLLLDDYEANAHIRSITGRCALHACDDAACAALLCGRGLAADLQDDQGCSPLHLSRSVGVARTLIQHGAFIEAQDKAGCTPLHRAVLRADHNVVVELLAQGADPNQANVEGNTPLHVARTSAIARRLLNARADPGRVNAAGREAGAIVEELFRRSPDPGPRAIDRRHAQ